MYPDYESFVKSVAGQKIAVLGMGISNRPLIHLLLERGARVTVCDRDASLNQSEAYRELVALGVEFCLGEGYLDHLSGFDVIFKTPGMRYDLPQLVVARNSGARVTSEMEVFFDVCPIQTIGVTGSDGKTTTTTLIAKILEAAGRRVHVGGNIGRPLLCDVPDFQPGDIAVLELSSFQLHTMQKSPQVAVVTNLSPNHLDVHKSMEEYVEAKTHIFRFQTQKDRLILNFDNAVTRRFADAAVGKVSFFSRRQQVQRGTYLKDGWIYRAYDGEVARVLDTADILLPGTHNIENYMAAIAATEGLAQDDAVRQVAKTFGGVEHRIELVRELHGVRYYNSSIDSSPARSRATLSVFPEKVVMIAGGKDKGIPYDDLGAVILDHVKTLVLIGATAGKILESVRQEERRRGAKNTLPVVECESYEQAVRAAQEAAVPGDVVVLSPASTSFDRFKNFEERGNLYKKLVHGLN